MTYVAKLDLGVPEGPALDLASHISRSMADCILDLRRSAVDVGKQWGPDLDGLRLIQHDLERRARQSFCIYSVFRSRSLRDSMRHDHRFGESGGPGLD